MKSMNKLALAAIFAVGMTLNANALLITPSSTPQWSGSIPSNPSADDIESITGTSAELTLAYKINIDGSEEGAFAGSYDPAFTPPGDAEDGTITHVSGEAAITGTPIYLVLKDGNHNPIWYIFDISSWNGTETITVQDFWADQGTISHLGIYTGGNTNVPDAGSTLMMLGAALTGIGLIRRKLAA